MIGQPTWEMTPPTMDFKIVRISCTFVLGFLCVSTGSAKAQCEESQCPAPLDTISSTVDTIVNSSDRAECFDDNTIITILCNRGFQMLVSEYDIVCDGRTGEFEDEGLCRVDMLTLILAIALMLVILFVSILLIFLVMKRRKTRRFVPDRQQRARPEAVANDEELIYANAALRPIENATYQNVDGRVPQEPEARVASRHALRDQSQQTDLEMAKDNDERRNSSGTRAPNEQTYYENTSNQLGATQQQ